MDIAILIPAYNPDHKLLTLLNDLKQKQINHIVVIDDGSDCKNIFKQLEPLCTILTHAKNKGKGAALKTGLSYIKNNLKNILGVITVDADGQHEISDILKVIDSFRQHSNCLVLGTRNFKENTVRLRSLIGNKLTKRLLKLRHKLDISDTQTGLRAIPTNIISEILEIKFNGYEFEMKMLLKTKKWGLKIKETPIKTIYLNKNESSHFNPILDSIKIYFVLLF